MRSLGEHVFALALTLWVGALWTVGYLVTPTLFAMIESRTLAGEVAGRLFSLTGWVGLGCAAYLLLFLSVQRGWAAFRSGRFWLIVLMLALGLGMMFGLQPAMAALKLQVLPLEVMNSARAEDFARLHQASSLLYLLQSLLGVALVIGTSRAGRN